VKVFKANVVYSFRSVKFFAVKDFQGSLQGKCLYCVFISVCKCSINCFIRVYGNLCGELNHKITNIKAASLRPEAVGCLRYF
jgi:hypothetical protein